MHRGVEAAAFTHGAGIYWNAPTREDDTNGQIALIERVAAGKYAGMVIAPDQSLALVTPVRRALARGLPIVIIGSPLLIPAGGKLFYILNNEEEGGRIAARRVALLLHGRGSVAVLGMNPDIAGIMVRARSFEQFLAENYPDIHVVDKRMGSFNVPHEQQVAEEALKANPSLDAIVALMDATMQGSLSTIDSNPAYRSVKVIGFDPGSTSFSSASLDSVIVQNMPEMGNRAINVILATRAGRTMPAQTVLEPMLVTRENRDSDKVRSWTSMDYRPGPFHLNWGTWQ
jgi:ribose transport system substrate-binding protein